MPVAHVRRADGAGHEWHVPCELYAFPLVEVNAGVWSNEIESNLELCARNWEDDDLWDEVTVEKCATCGIWLPDGTTRVVTYRGANFTQRAVYCAACAPCPRCDGSGWYVHPMDAGRGGEYCEDLKTRCDCDALKKESTDARR